jgi:hypothetical protein
LTEKEDYTTQKVQLSHLVYSERSEAEIIRLMQSTLSERRQWITADSPTAAEILKQFPRFCDTPSLVSQLSQQGTCCFDRFLDESPAMILVNKPSE